MTDNTALVRRFIQLRSGRRAWRYVKPDNPNIVRPQPDVPDAPVAPKVEAPPMETLFTGAGYLGCCGAQFYVARQQPVGYVEPLEEAQLRRWKEIYEQHYYLHYLREMERHKESDQHHYAHYKRMAEQYSFETMKGKGNLNRDLYPILKENGLTSPGICISNHSFEGSVETPAGLFVRDDYPVKGPFEGPEARYDLSDSIIETPEPAAEPSRARVKVGKNDFGAQIGCPGIHIIHGMDQQDLANRLSTYIADKKEIEPGHIVTFVLNRTQQTARNAATLAAAGFRCTLVTGNSNHPNASILYLYERTVTEADKKL